MKRKFLILLVAFVGLGVSAQAQSQAAPAFDKMKALVGEWERKASDGSGGKVSFRLASGGSTIIETMMPPNEPEMISMYHRDGDSLAMTHYCSAGNQPRMRAEVPPGEIKTLDFKFVDATNLKKPNDGHIHNLTVNFQDNDHVTMIWTWREAGKDQSLTLNLERKK